MGEFTAVASANLAVRGDESGGGLRESLRGDSGRAVNWTFPDLSSLLDMVVRDIALLIARYKSR